MIELDPQLQALIIAGLTWLVTEGLKSLSGALGIDLSGAKTAVVAALVALVLAGVNGLLGLIPAQYHQVAQVIMTLLVAILGAFGIHNQAKKFGARG